MRELPKLDLQRTQQCIETFIRDYVKGAGKDGVVLGVSGGLDSACVATLAANALGPEKVLGVQMPERIEPKHDQDDCDRRDAQDLIEQLGIQREQVLLEDHVRPFYKLNVKDDRNTMGNVKARMRMNVLYAFANDRNRLVAGTGDKSEELTGYFTKYGDGGVDMLPIGNLYKTHVRDLSKEIGVPEAIVKKKSSPNLWKGQTAEGELGMKYETLDKILYNLVDLRIPPENIDYDRKAIDHVAEMVRDSAHKRAMPPVAEVTYHA